MVREDAVATGRISLAAMAAFLAAACGEPGGPAEWTVDVDTLADGTIHVTNTPPDAEASPTWRLEEELRIGAVEGAGAETFGAIKGIAALEDRRVAVLDAQAREIRIFGPEGTHQATYGGQGEGPGELMEGYGLMRGPEGRLWVPDEATNRMSVYHPDSGFVASWNFNILSNAYIWRGIMTEEGRVWKPSIAMDGTGDPVLRVYGPGMTPVDTVPLGERPEYDREDPPWSFYWEAPGGMPRGYHTVPWYPRPKTALDPGAVVWSTDRGNPDYRIKRWEPGGDTTLVIETRRAPVPVTQSERDSAIDEIREYLQEHGAGLDQDWSKIPEVKPAVRYMLVAEDGKLWVRVSAPGSRAVYDVYHRDGRWAGTATAEADPHGGPAPLVRGDRMWAVVDDDLGVQYVVRFAIVRDEGR